MTKKTKTIALLAAIPAAFGLAFGAGGAAADTPAPQTVSVERQNVDLDLDDLDLDDLNLDDIHVPAHIRAQIDRALAGTGIQIPWHLFDDDWDDLDDDDDDDWDDDDWDDDWDD